MITRIMKAFGYVKQQELEEVQRELRRRSYDADRFESSYKSVKRQLIEMMRTRKESEKNLVSLVKFTARLPSGDHYPTEFKLGLGPCGKYVSRLDVRQTQHELQIIQLHTDGSYKHFHYFNCDILGRVQVEYEAQGANKLREFHDWLTSRP